MAITLKYINVITTISVPYAIKTGVGVSGEITTINTLKKKRIALGFSALVINPVTTAFKGVTFFKGPSWMSKFIFLALRDFQPI